MTLGVLFLLLLTALAIFAVMTFGGKPKLVATGTAAAVQSASAALCGVFFVSATCA
jgi:methyl-accepting chemotaxis protein